MIRAANCVITNETLCKSLHLPEGVRINRIKDVKKDGVIFELELIDFGDSLPIVAEGEHFPTIYPNIKTEYDELHHIVSQNWSFML